MWNRRMLGATLANQLVLDRVASNNKLTDDGTKLSRSATRLTLNFPETAPTHTHTKFELSFSAVVPAAVFTIW